ncbi:MAG TPA: glutamate--tRNA ligase [Chitinophagaceae bacterium]|nr:glutamate--tRNA ligase [Chitinophagaceae bacterium]
MNTIMHTEIRTRFAPSPTGGLHLGGVRTALYSYLFAKKHGGKFILRIEDTDQSRYVEGAEKYIMDCLSWCGIESDENPMIGGPYAPYRQSERKAAGVYSDYAHQLVKDGHAYYAFDTPEELDKMRHEFKSALNPSPQYDHSTRMNMRNSLTLSKDEVVELKSQNTPYVVRILMPENETIVFNDLIRGEIHNESRLVDDKVLLKADGMPTYHLAVVVDDYLMKITHAFRGEEWLPSAPVHILLWKYLGWEDQMPTWAHLPLILKPDGHGKLSKRDGDRLGFPVFAMNWRDPASGDLSIGFHELGFLPEAFINLLAMLGWHSGTEQELFSLPSLIELFSIERVHKGGAKFDFEKAKWFNHEWIKQYDLPALTALVHPILVEKGLRITDRTQLETIIGLVRERCTLLPEFYTQCSYFYQAPESIDIDAIQGKWTLEKQSFFNEFCGRCDQVSSWDAVQIESTFKELAVEKNCKPGDLQLPFRIMLVGGKFGPSVFQIAAILGKEDVKRRIRHVVDLLP